MPDTSPGFHAPRKKIDVVMVIFFLLMGVVFLVAILLATQGYGIFSIVIQVAGFLTIWRVLRWRYPTAGKQ